MKVLKALILGTLFSTASVFSQGQTTNTGTLYVSPGTLMTVVSSFNNTDSGEYKNDGLVAMQLFLHEKTIVLQGFYENTPNRLPT